MLSHMQRLGIVSLVCLIPVFASAEEGRRPHGVDTATGAPARRCAKGTPGKGEERENAPEHAGAPGVPLTLEQAEFRQQLVTQQRLFVRDVSRGGGPAVAAEKKRAIELHWQHAMRLLRVREVAQQANDEEVLRRVDDLRDREDETFVAVMRRIKGEPASQGAGAAR